MVECTRCATDLLPGMFRWSRPTVVARAGFVGLIHRMRPAAGCTDAEADAWRYRMLDRYQTRKLSRLHEGSPLGDFARQKRALDLLIDTMPAEERDAIYKEQDRVRREGLRRQSDSKEPES